LLVLAPFSAERSFCNPGVVEVVFRTCDYFKDEGDTKSMNSEIENGIRNEFAVSGVPHFPFPKTKVLPPNR